MPNVGDIIRAADFNGAGIKAGAVVPFYNVTLSGRYPIFWGESEADTSWLVCDGGSDLHGGNVPNLNNRFIMGVTSVSAAKKTGGSTTTSSTSTGGTVGATTITSSTSGSHNHIIGKYNYGTNDSNSNPGVTLISTSQVLSLDISANSFNSIVWIDGRVANKTSGNNSSLSVNNWRFGGSTSRNITTDTPSGGSSSHPHSFTGTSHTHTITPPYYSLIYVVKLP